MPFKRKRISSYWRQRKKRSFRSRRMYAAKRIQRFFRRRRRRTMRIRRSGQRNFFMGFAPASQVARLRYGEVVKFNAAAGTTSFSVQAYALDNIYDPNITGVGHQPRGYDQYSTYYNKYVVLGTRWRIKYMYNSSMNDVCMSSRLCDTQGELTTVFDHLEQTRVRKTYVGDVQNSHSQRWVTGYVNLSKWTQRSSKDDTRQESTGAGPILNHRRAILELIQWGLDAATDPGDLVAVVELTYTVKFYDRKDTAES